MLKYVFLAALTTFTFSAQAQTDFKPDQNSVEQIRARRLSRLPKGTKVIFDANINIPAFEYSIQLVNGQRNCYLFIGSDKAKQVEQFINAGTTREITSSQDANAAVFFSREVYISCDINNISVGGFADLLKGKVSFEFPPLEPAQEFTF